MWPLVDDAPGTVRLTAGSPIRLFYISAYSDGLLEFSAVIAIIGIAVTCSGHGAAVTGIGVIPGDGFTDGSRLRLGVGALGLHAVNFVHRTADTATHQRAEKSAPGSGRQLPGATANL